MYYVYIHIYIYIYIHTRALSERAWPIRASRTPRAEGVAAQEP